MLRRRSVTTSRERLNSSAMMTVRIMPKTPWNTAWSVGSNVRASTRLQKILSDGLPGAKLANAVGMRQGEVDRRLIRCPSCGATNRVPREKLEQGLAPRCGRCKTPLPVGLDGTPITVTDATFAGEVERSPVPVVVDMWAEWCGPCRMVAPVIDELAAQMAGRVRFAKLNVDENPATAGRFNVRSIPTLLVIQGGREVDRIVGAQPKAEIARRLERIGV
jgi:thioredoxin 2